MVAIPPPLPLMLERAEYTLLVYALGSEPTGTKTPPEHSPLLSNKFPPMQQEALPLLMCDPPGQQKSGTPVLQALADQPLGQVGILHSSRGSRAGRAERADAVTARSETEVRRKCMMPTGRVRSGVLFAISGKKRQMMSNVRVLFVSP